MSIKISAKSVHLFKYCINKINKYRVREITCCRHIEDLSLNKSSGPENIRFPIFIHISPEIWSFGKWGKATTDQYTSWPNGILFNSKYWAKYTLDKLNHTRKPCAQSEYSDQHGHMLCALGLRCVINAQRDAKNTSFPHTQKEETLMRMGVCQQMAISCQYKWARIWQKVSYRYINQNQTYDASAKYYHLRAFSINLKQLSSKLTNIWKFE